MRKEKILILLFLILTSLFFIPKHASASATLYFGPIEKTYDDNGSLYEEKVYYPAGNSTAVKSTDYNLKPRTYNLSYLFPDHLGSMVLVTDEDGKVKESYVYYPYGDVPDGTSLGNQSLAVGLSSLANDQRPTTSDKLYTGQRLDGSTSLYYYNARYYNPTIGHFISADEAEGSNRYSYVSNNPIMKNDPSGNDPEVTAGDWTKYEQMFGIKIRNGMGEWTIEQIESLSDVLVLFPKEVYQGLTFLRGNTSYNAGGEISPSKGIIEIQGARTTNLGLLGPDLNYQNINKWLKENGPDWFRAKNSIEYTTAHELVHAMTSPVNYTPAYYIPSVKEFVYQTSKMYGEKMDIESNYLKTHKGYITADQAGRLHEQIIYDTDTILFEKQYKKMVDKRMFISDWANIGGAEEAVAEYGQYYYLSGRDPKICDVVPCSFFKNIEYDWISTGSRQGIYNKYYQGAGYK